MSDSAVAGAVWLGRRLVEWVLDWLCMLAAIGVLVFILLAPAMPASDWSVDLQLVIVANIMTFATPLVPFRRVFVSVNPPKLRWGLLWVGVYWTALALAGGVMSGVLGNAVAASLAFPFFAVGAAVVAGVYLLIYWKGRKLLAGLDQRGRAAVLIALCLFLPFYGWHTARALKIDDCMDRGGRTLPDGSCDRAAP